MLRGLTERFGNTTVQWGQQIALLGCLLLLTGCGGGRGPATGPHFFVSIRNPGLSAVQGGQATLTIGLERVGGFGEPIRLSLEGVPQGVEASFSVNPVLPNQPSTQLTLRASLQTPVGTYTILVRAQGGAVQREACIQLSITPAAPDFNIQLSASSIGLVQGGSGTLQVLLTRIGGFADPITLSLEGAPAGVSAEFTPPTLSGSQNASTLTVRATANAPVGTFSLTVVASSGSIRRTAQFNLTLAVAPDFTLTLGSSEVSLQPGGQATVSITVTRIGGFAQPVAFSATGVPAGVTVSFNPSTLPSDQTTASMTVQVSVSALPSTHSITVRGVAGSLTRTATLTLRISEAPDFSIGVEPSSLTVQQGGVGSATVRLTRVGGFSETVALSLQGAPAGVSASFTPSSLAPNQASATLNLQVAAQVAPGTYTLQVVGSAASRTRTATLTLEVRVPPDFLIALNPSSLSVAQGGTATVQVAISAVGGFDEPVSLAINGLLAGISATFNPSAVRPGQQSQLTLQVDPQVASASYTLTVQGTAGSLTHTATLTLQVLVSLQHTIQPIFTQRCAVRGCHDPLGRAADLDLSAGNAYASIVNVPSVQDPNWIRVVPGDPMRSLLYRKVAEDNPPVGSRMPLGGRLSDEQILLIRLWIEQGARNN